MNATMRNIDERLYRLLKARAAGEGRAVGEVLDDAIREYLLSRRIQRRKRRSRPGFLDLGPVDLGPGTEHLSAEIDDALFMREP
jgi:hypothetical protein